MAVRTYCPHCHSRITNYPRNSYCVVNMKKYGSPFELCTRCGKEYVRGELREPAFYLSIKQNVKYSFLLLPSLALLLGIGGLLDGILNGNSEEVVNGIVVLVGALVVYACNIGIMGESRNELKNKLVKTSRKRIIEDFQYFMKTVINELGEVQIQHLNLKDAEWIGLYQYVRDAFDKDAIPNIREYTDALRPKMPHMSAF